MKYYLVAILFGLLALSGCGDANGPTRPNSFTPLTSIEITAENTQIANQTSTQLRAIGNFSGLFTRDITADVFWASDDSAVATVSNDTGTTGRATGVFAGSAGISAILDGITGDFTLAVSNATISSLEIPPLLLDIPKGLTSQFTANGTFSDATTQDISFDVSWSSSDPLAATISNAVGSKGLASAVAVGSTTITATFDGTTASTTMTVSDAILTSIVLSPLTPSILNLSTSQMTATGTFSDGSSQVITDQVSWVSSTLTIASISNTTGSKGLLSTLSDGSTTISASLDGVPAETLLTVTGGNLSTIEILPAENTYIHITPVIPLQLSAEGSFANGARDISTEVIWSSSDLNVATIDPQGVVMTVGAGTTEIQASKETVGGTVTGTKNLTVAVATFMPGTLTIAPATADSPTIASGTRLQFTASGDFSDVSTRDLTAAVSWSSSAGTIATVSDAAPDKGVAKGETAGTSTITADFRGLVQGSDSADLVVNALTLDSIAIDNQLPSILPGERLQLTVTATYTDASTQDITADVDWSSADNFVAIFHDPLKANGEILGVDSGSVEITATFGGETDLLTVTVR